MARFRRLDWKLKLERSLKLPGAPKNRAELFYSPLSKTFLRFFLDSNMLKYSLTLAFSVVDYIPTAMVSLVCVHFLMSFSNGRGDADG
jgi:hypothetical protein